MFAGINRRKKMSKKEQKRVLVFRLKYGQKKALNVIFSPKK